MSTLFTPLKIRDCELRNRIVVSPMCQYSAKDGFAGEWHLVHLGSRAVGGAAAVIAEATAVSPEGRISTDDLGIWKDEHISYLRTITGFISSHGAVPGIQLAHAGRKAGFPPPWKGEKALAHEAGGWTPVAPSAIRFSDDAAPPSALNREGIENVKHDFFAAASRAVAAGFRIIEIHAAHGYLLHQFLSPFSNHREDEYGGSFENRCRLLVEIANGIRQAVPPGHALWVRLSCTDWADGGWTIADSVKVMRILREAGVDLADCSSGGIIPGVHIPLEPGYQVQFSERIRKETGILTGAVGLITGASQAEKILENGQADLVLLGREFLRDPYFPFHAAFELGDETAWPNQYLRARKK